jgi:hypothetical protein
MFYKKILNFEIFHVKNAKLVKTILCRIFSLLNRISGLIETGTYQTKDKIFGWKSNP